MQLPKKVTKLSTESIGKDDGFGPVIMLLSTDNMSHDGPLVDQKVEKGLEFFF